MGNYSSRNQRNIYRMVIIIWLILLVTVMSWIVASDLHRAKTLFFSVARVHGDGSLLSASWLRNSDTAHPDTGLHRDEESFHHIWGRRTVRLPPYRVVACLSWVSSSWRYQSLYLRAS